MRDMDQSDEADSDSDDLVMSLGLSMRTSIRSSNRRRLTNKWQTVKPKQTKAAALPKHISLDNTGEEEQLQGEDLLDDLDEEFPEDTTEGFSPEKGGNAGFSTKGGIMQSLEHWEEPVNKLDQVRPWLRLLLSIP